MKKLLLSASLSGILLLTACENEENKAESQEKKSESVEKKDESTEQNTDGLNHAKPVNEMTQEEYDTYLLTQNRSYLTKEQQERYDELLEMKGSTPAENDEKNQAYNNEKRNEVEGNGGGTALITPPETEEEKEELRKKQEEQQNEVANKQAEEYGKAHPEGEPSNEGKMGPGPEDPDYKPDPRFTEGAEGYDPVEGAQDPNKDDFTFK